MQKPDILISSQFAPYIDVLHQYNMTQVYDSIFNRPNAIIFEGTPKNPIYPWVMIVTIDIYRNLFSLSRLRLPKRQNFYDIIHGIRLNSPEELELMFSRMPATLVLKQTDEGF